MASSYGKANMLDELVTDANDFFTARLIDNKNTIVNSYLTRDF